MRIHRLSESTVRAMGTCQSLTESSSLVKELIDNALDANATSVAIEISANALDIVQVKDNGHGIALEDRGAMAVRYSTSKIIDVQELKVLGGRSLGFRGEALSSACEMAGEMVITTRVEGEGVAEACRIDRKGNIEIRERASHPVGTTVRILDFLKDLPVRREHALKNSTKTLAKIKHTMQAYAFARPNIRFSLRILKSGKGNWSYTPKRKAPPQLDPSLIIGKDAARECIWLTYPSPTGDDRRGVCDNNYSIEAFVPKPNAGMGATASLICVQR
jgi:DNA mismatch repair protein MutL